MRSGEDTSAPPAERLRGAAEAPEISPFWRRLFLFYLEGYFARNFHAVRTSRSGQTPDPGNRPLIVYANHPSWWDPIHFILLASLKLPERWIYGPFDTEALGKYRFFEKLGAFGVDRSLRGARKFFSVSEAVLARPGASLWLTPEGEFTDPRRRPLRLRPGLARLARRVPEALVVPLAVEYPFWNERRPEALTRFGPAVDLAAEGPRSVGELTDLFERCLEKTMESLAAEAESRDPGVFETLVEGKSGISGVYDGWRRVRAYLQGRDFNTSHGSLDSARMERLL